MSAVRQRVARATAAVGFLHLVRHVILGLGERVLIAHRPGTGLTADAFFAAGSRLWGIPELGLTRRVVAGVFREGIRGRGGQA